MRAEATAQDAERRLVVAQEQLAEYAAQKRLDADGLLRHAQQVEQARVLFDSTISNTFLVSTGAAWHCC